MKPRLWFPAVSAFVAVAVGYLSISAPPAALAAPIYKINNTDNLNLTTSWSTTSGSQTPNPSSIGSTDAAYFNEETMLGNKTVSLGGDLALGGLALDYVATNSANSLIINSGGTLTLSGTTLYGNGKDGSGGVYNNAGILLNRGPGGTMTIDADVVVGGNQTWTMSRSLTVGGAVDIGTRTLSFNVAGGTTLLNGPLSGSGIITKTGGSNFNLLGDGTNFTGEIRNTSTQALAIGLTTAKNATSVSSTGGTGGYLAIFSAGTTYIRNINVTSSNGLRGDYGDAGTKVVEIEQTVDGAISSQIAQGGRVIAITKTGAATLTISTSSNNMSGAINVNNGTLKLGSTSALGTTGSGTAVASGGVLDLNGQTIGAEALTLNGTGVSSGGSLVNTSGTAASLSGAVTLGSASSIGGTGNITLSGGVSGSGLALTKVGASTLTLSGTNAYTGTTTISGGTLSLGSAGTIASTVIDVGSSGTFDISGLSAGLSLGSGQRLGGRGTLLGDVAFGSGSQLAFDEAGPLVVGSGSLSFAPGFGIANLFGVDWDSLQLNTPYTVVSTSQVFTNGDIGDFGYANRTAVGSTGREAYFQSGSLQFVIVPEPATVGLAAVGVLLGGWAFRRRLIAAGG